MKVVVSTTLTEVGERRSRDFGFPSRLRAVSLCRGSAGTRWRRGAACSDNPAGRLAAAAAFRSGRERALSRGGGRGREWPSQSDGFEPGVRASGARAGPPRVSARPGQRRGSPPRAQALESGGRGSSCGRTRSPGCPREASAEAETRAGPGRGAARWRSSEAAGSRIPSPRPGCGAEELVAGEGREAPPVPRAG